MPKKDSETTEKTIQNLFSKKQILNSKKFALNKDFLNATLEEDKEYSLEEVEELIGKFKKGKV